MPIDLAAVLTDAFVKVVAGKVTEKTIEGILSWATSSTAGRKGNPLAATDQEQLKDLLRSDRSVWSSLKAQFKLTDRRGLLVVGPSGGGKSRILRALIGDEQLSESKTTARLTTSTMRIGSRITCMRDTVGLINPLGSEELSNLLTKHPPKVVCFVSTFGLLHTADSPALHRTGAGQFKTLQALRKHCLKEEIDFIKHLSQLNAPSCPVPYFISFTNKLEHWDHDFEKAKIHYTHPESEYSIAMNELIRNWGGIATNHQWAYGSAYFNTFPGKQKGPSAKVGREGAELSMQLLRALLHYRLLEG